MSHVLTEADSRAAPVPAFAWPPPPNAAMHAEADESLDDLPTTAGFVALQAAFGPTGGAPCGDDLARLLDRHGVGNFVRLARLIASGEVFGFEWRETLWIPMFQFDRIDLSVRPAAQRVVAELDAGFDGWARASWFVRPNVWLQGRRPVDALEGDLPEVLNAARADRFIAMG